MARSLRNAKILASSLSDGLSVGLFRRGYAAEANGAVSGKGYGRVGSRIAMVGKVEERAAIKEEASSSAWAPDPITGFYRPANRAAEIDPAELREMLLNHRARPH